MQLTLRTKNRKLSNREEELIRKKIDRLRHLDQVHRRRELVEIAAVGGERRAHDLGGVTAVGIEDVVAPVGVEDRSVGIAILPVGRFTVGRAKHLEKIRKEIDQHGGTIGCGEEQIKTSGASAATER